MNDSDHQKSFVTGLLDRLGTALVTSVAGGVVYILVALGGPIVTAISSAATKEVLLRLVAFLAFLVCVAVAWALRLRSQVHKPLSRKFDFDDYGGYYIDRETKRGVCARCLADGLVIHLMDVDGTGDGAKMCNACRSAYRARPKK